MTTHTILVLKMLPWLPKFYFNYKVLLLTFMALTLNGCGLLYLMELNPVSPKPSRSELESHKSARRAFRNYAPQLWIPLPIFICKLSLSQLFKLKKHLLAIGVDNFFFKKIVLISFH